MASILNALEAVMNTEQQQLSAGQINGSALQRVTEDKSSLLATLDYLETQRQAEQQPAAPLAPEVATQWQSVRQKIQQLNNMNQHNGWLLESQLNHTEQALAILKPHQSPDFYGADGQAKSAAAYTNKKIAY